MMGMPEKAGSVGLEEHFPAPAKAGLGPHATRSILVNVIRWKNELEQNEDGVEKFSREGTERGKKVHRAPPTAVRVIKWCIHSENVWQFLLK